MANKVGQIMSVMKYFANDATAQYQKIGGKAVTQFERGGAKQIRIRQGSKSVTRTIPSTGITSEGDSLVIKNAKTTNVGNKRVHTRTEETYEYSNYSLEISKKQLDDVYAGNERIGSIQNTFFTNPNGNRYKMKEFLDKDGNRIKTVFYDPVTGLRTHARSEHGTVLFDNKGLPIFSDNWSPADLGGLDKLV